MVLLMLVVAANVINLFLEHRNREVAVRSAEPGC
jgi:hypothetical protein